MDRVVEKEDKVESKLNSLKIKAIVELLSKEGIITSEEFDRKVEELCNGS